MDHCQAGDSACKRATWVRARAKGPQLSLTRTLDGLWGEATNFDTEAAHCEVHFDGHLL